MDLQLTNVEHFSESDIEEKMRELNVSISLLMLRCKQDNVNRIMLDWLGLSLAEIFSYRRVIYLCRVFSRRLP